MENTSNYRFLKLLNSSNEAFYWLGFIYADGTLNYKTGRLRVRVSLKDEKFIAKLSSFLDTKLVYETNKSVGIDIASRRIFPILVDKFKFKQNKTYNPPENLNFLETNEQFLSFLIGFIDGDGCIRKQHNRQDCTLAIKCHNSWKPVLLEFEERLYNICKISKKRVLTKTNNAGFAFVCFSDHKVLNFLKNKTKELNLPILQRKWSLIDTTKKYKESFEFFRENVLQLYNKGMTQKQIALKLNKSKSYVCQAVRSRK